MIYVIIAGIFILIGVALVAITRDTPYVITVADNESGGIKNLAVDLRAPEAVGVSPRYRKIKAKIKRCYNVAKRKVKQGEDLYEFERWVYENYYHVLNKTESKTYKNFAILPHKHGRARIEIIAEYIVKKTNCKLSDSEVKEVIGEINTHTPLHFDELSALKDALRLALLKEVSTVAASSARYRADKKRAAAHTYVVPKSTYSECYLYWLKRMGKLNNAYELLEKSDINIDNVEHTFTTTLINNVYVVRNCIASMGVLKEILPLYDLIKLSNTHNLLTSNDIYAHTDVNSQVAYLGVIEELSFKYDVSERAIVEACLDLERLSGDHFAKFLYEKRVLKAHLRGKTYGEVLPFSSKAKQIFYIATVYGITTLAAVVLGALTRSIGYGIAVGIAVWFAVYKTVEYLVQRAHKSVQSARPIPKLDRKELPQESATLVIVPHYIASVEDAENAVKGLLRLRGGNAGKNIDFALLIDYKKSDAPVTESDREINSLLDKRLAGYADVGYFVRKKILINGNYGAYERKRGAIMQLNEMLLSGDTGSFEKIGLELKRYEYVVCLDADSELLPSAVLNAVNTIEHPLNREYDLMAFNSAYNMYTMQSLYSKKFYFASGYEVYGSYSDYYYNFIKKSIFCGKGIYRLASFNEKLKGVLPNGRVLSHDIIEGAIVNTGRLNEVVYEDAPISLVSDMSRRNRWLRGDIQLLEFLGSKIKGCDGNTRTINKEPIYGHVMLSNFINALGVTFAFVLLALALFTLNAGAIFAAVVVIMIVPLLQVIDSMLGIGKGMRRRYAVKHSLMRIVDTVFYVLMLPFYALTNFIVIIATAMKIIFVRSGELRWQTFGASQRESIGLAGYIKMVLHSLILTIILAAAGAYYNAVLGYAVIAFAAILVNYISGVPINANRRRITQADTEFLKSIARKTYNFFRTTEQKNALVPDNYQIRPYIGVATATSPTNIGFSLLAEISACELEITDIKAAHGNIMNILKEVNSLKKYKGHLYNWYDINDKHILAPNYISSVDSANFVASLITVRQFLIKNSLEGEELVEKLIRNTDFSALYDKKRGLYYIGYNTIDKKFEGHYDLLASEARILYYITAAFNRDSTAWNNLIRETISTRGNTLASWSGTMFEYLMPSIFMRGSDYGLIERSNRNVTAIQSASKCNGLWGVSESGYYKFDNCLRYQYFAFGLSKLSRRVIDDRCVISPYSTALALMYAPEKSMANMRLIEAEGGVGEFGFYEAIDFTQNKSIVYSYMAHHQGMVITSIANALCNNAIVEYFMSDEQMAGAKLLLSEKQNFNRSVKREQNDFVYDKAYNAADYECACKADEMPKYNVLSNGKYSVVINANGSGYSYTDGKFINKYRYDHGNYGFMAAFIDENGNKFSPIAGSKTGGEHKAILGIDECSFIGENCKMQVFVPHCLNGEVRKLSWLNASNRVENIKCDIFMDLAMSRYDEDIAHPVFNDMFVDIEYNADKKAIVASRKNRDNGEDFYTAMVITGASVTEVNCNRYNYIGRNQDFATRHNTNKLNSLGDVIYPCFGVTCNIAVAPNSIKDINVIIFTANKKEEIVAQLDILSNSNYADYLRESAKVQALSTVRKYEMEPHDMQNYRSLARVLLLGSYRQAPMHIEPLRVYGNLGLNGEYKTIIKRCGTYSKSIVKLCDIVMLLNNAGIKCNLLIITEENVSNEEYVKFENLKTANIAILKKCLLDKSAIECAYIDFDNLETVLNEKIYKKIDKMPDIEENISINSLRNSITKAITLKTGSGGFTNEGYVVLNKPLLPYAHIIAYKEGGSVMTENGGGYTYYQNSRENKLTAWNNEPVKDQVSERVYAVVDGKFARINKLINGYVEYKSNVIYANTLKGIKCTVDCMMICEGKIKIYRVNLENELPHDKNVNIIFDCDIAADWKFNETLMQVLVDDNNITEIRNAVSMKSVYLKVSEKARPVKVLRSAIGDDLLIDEEGKGAYIFNSKLLPNSNTTCCFALSMDRDALINLNLSDISGAKEMSVLQYNNVTKLKIETGDKYLDALFNNLMRQVVFSRINGRTGYYQAGGAIGFRDQLQDCLALLYSDPLRVREHIIEAAARQFPEGDVLHWWHDPNIGVRTKISDDKLFLPYVVSEYIKFTGDKEILNEQIPYLKGSLLNDGEESRYDSYIQSDFKESLVMHCKRAIDSALRYGEHGLLLIGAGDWNDALNGIGLHGKGESVWLTMFCYGVIEEFIEYLASADRLYYIKAMEKLKIGIDGAYNGAWYRRAYTDDGEWLGDASGERCKIDLICQAFAVLAKCSDDKRRNIAMKSAYDMLVDEKNGIIKLLTPPFKSKDKVGYIGKYPQGVRENGGQYTHAAAWFLMALCDLGKHETAYKLLKMLNPAEKCSTESGNSVYMGEPYVLAGDVYAGGRMGWSWYTGSAAWFYKLILEKIIGLRIENKNIIVNPNEIECLNDITVYYQYNSAQYKIKIIKTGNKRIIINGVNYPNRIIPLYDSDKYYDVRVEY